MTDDAALARQLTDGVLGTPGVTAVFPVQPLLHVASEGIANALDLEAPEVLVDVDRSERLLTITAHVATASDCSTPLTLGAVADAIRDIARREHAVGDGDVVVFVKARLIAEPLPQPR